MDFVAKIQNMFGWNLTVYEKMLNKAQKQIEEKLDGMEMEWYRYEISQLTNGAMVVMYYGEAKKI